MGLRAAGSVISTILSTIYSSLSPAGPSIACILEIVRNQMKVIKNTFAD